MRFQNNIDTTMSMPLITGETMFTDTNTSIVNVDMRREGTARFIPQNEQDEDLWRDTVVPGRDPVTRVRGSG